MLPRYSTHATGVQRLLTVPVDGTVTRGLNEFRIVTVLSVEAARRVFHSAVIRLLLVVQSNSDLTASIAGSLC